MSGSSRGALTALTLVAFVTAGCSSGGSATSAGDGSSSAPPSTARATATMSIKASVTQWLAGPAGTDLRKAGAVAAGLGTISDRHSARFRATCRELRPVGGAMLDAPSSPDPYSAGVYGQIAVELKDAGSHCRNPLGPEFNYDLQQASINLRHLKTQLRELGVLP